MLSNKNPPLFIFSRLEGCAQGHHVFLNLDGYKYKQRKILFFEINHYKGIAYQT